MFNFCKLLQPDFRSLLLECNYLIVNFHYRTCTFQQLFSEKKVAQKLAVARIQKLKPHPLPQVHCGYFRNLLPKSVKDKNYNQVHSLQWLFFFLQQFITIHFHKLTIFLLLRWLMAHRARLSYRITN